MALTGMDFLKAEAPATATKKKKNDTPIVELPDTKENREMIKNWVAGKKETSGESERKAEEETLRPMAAKARFDACQADSTFYSSVKIKIGETILNFSSPCNTAPSRRENPRFCLAETILLTVNLQ